jgi:hypothetical protein
MRGLIVAMEYLGTGLGAGASGRRVPVCEHAYEPETATLAGRPAGRSPGGVSFLENGERPPGCGRQRRYP